MPTLVIRDEDGKEIKDRTKCAIGSRCRWTAESKDGSVSGVRWSVDKAVQDYVVMDVNGSVDEPRITYVRDLDGPVTDWYWMMTGRVAVKVSAQVAGSSVERTIVATVEGTPSLVFAAETDKVRVAKLQHSDKIPALTFGGVQDGEHGIHWTARLVAPPARGEFTFTQVMSIYRKFTLDDNTTYEISSDGHYVLDEEFHYGIAERGIELDEDDEGKTVRCLDNEVLVLEEADSPSTKLPRKVERTSMIHKVAGLYKRVEVDESFRLFLMYKPDSGIWISLAHLDWRWAGVAEYVQDEWVLTSSDYSKSPKGKVRTMLPKWSENRHKFLG